MYDTVIANDEFATFQIEVTDSFKTFTMPNPSGYTYNYFIDWGDSNTETVTTPLKTHTYTTNGTYIIKFKGICPSINFEFLSDYMMVGVDTLGELILTQLSFFYCNLQYINFGVGVDISTITNFNSLFYSCSSLESVDFGDIDTSLVTSFDFMFNGCYALVNINVEKLKTNSAVSMVGMFSGCASILNLDTSSFNMNNVNDVRQMFYNDANIANNASDWWNTQPQITAFSDCFGSNTSRPNYASIPASWK